MIKLDLSEKARLPFVCAVVLCFLLTILLIVLAVFWPRIPAYMRSPVCVDKECLDASAQVGTGGFLGCACVANVFGSFFSHVFLDPSK